MKKIFTISANGAEFTKNGANTFTFNDAMAIIEENKETMTNVRISEVMQFYVAVSTRFGVIIYKDDAGNQLFDYDTALEIRNTFVTNNLDAEVIAYNQRKLITAKLYECIDKRNEVVELLNGYALTCEGNVTTDLNFKLLKEGVTIYSTTVTHFDYYLGGFVKQVLTIIEDIVESIG